ncbi:MAG: DUF4197 domain-containing protein [Gammaproteobacteria bacterium]
MKKLLLGAAMVVVGLTVDSHAGWTDFFDNAVSKGKEVLGNSDVTSGVSDSDIASGLKEALLKGSKAAVENLGTPDGFLKNADVKIPMPKHLSMIESGLRTIGQDSVADSFVESMNRAAERAVPEAANVFTDAVKNMSIDDAKGILNGGDHAATDYLRRTSSDKLRDRFKPLVNEAIGQVGVTGKYQDLVNKADVLSGFVDTDKLDLGNYVTDKALDGVFFMVGEEERKIRENPAARTSELLKKVFAK